MFLFAGMTLLLLPMFVQSVAMVLHPVGVVSFLGSTLLTCLTGASLLSTAYIARLCYFLWLSEEEEADASLLFLAVVLPVVLLVSRFNPLPSADDSKANCMITITFLLRLGSLMDMPAAHSVMQFLISFPIFT